MEDLRVQNVHSDRSLIFEVVIVIILMPVDRLQDQRVVATFSNEICVNDLLIDSKVLDTIRRLEHAVELDPAQLN